MGDLADLRADIRIDLQDAVPASERWADATLDRHLLRAMADYSRIVPIESKDTIATDADSRNVSLATLTQRIRIVAAEYPTGQYPPEFVPFTLWGDVLTLDLQAVPGGTPNVNIYWHKTHSLTETTSTHDAEHDDILAGGAAGYAALEWASFASNRLNVGGDDVWGKYSDFGMQRIAEFEARLRKLPQASKLKTSRLYTPVDQRLTSQTTDPGPQ